MGAINHRKQQAAHGKRPNAARDALHERPLRREFEQASNGKHALARDIWRALQAAPHQNRHAKEAYEKRCRYGAAASINAQSAVNRYKTKGNATHKSRHFKTKDVLTEIREKK